MYYSEDTANRARKAVAFDGPHRRGEVERLLKRWCARCALSQLGGLERRKQFEREAGELRREVESVAKGKSMFACEGR